jgi:hypothetical protein
MCRTSGITGKKNKLLNLTEALSEMILKGLHFIYTYIWVEHENTVINLRIHRRCVII